MHTARSTESRAAVAPLLRVEGLDKSFPGVHALDHLDFDLAAGEVHVVVGENGAGKSTFMKIISGALRMDGGRILIQGKEVDVSDPFHARRLGIGMVYQELSLIPNLTVAENIFLGRLPRRPLLRTVAWADVFSRAKELLDDLGVRIDPHSRVADLGIAERQLTEIAKALAVNVRVLLLDEPTSSLSDQERSHLFEIIRRLQAKGVGIIYVSHRLTELPQIAQRVTVLRDGKKIGEVTAADAREDALISMMVGRDIRELFPKVKTSPGRELLRVRNLSVKGVLRDVNLVVRAGEVVGLFGLMGAKRTELAQAIFGLRPITEGEVLVEGTPMLFTQPAAAIRAGLGLLTENRRDGLVPLLPIPANITLASLRRICSGGFLRRALEREEAQRLVDGLSVRTPWLGQRVGNLSGGNQQKVALAKWLCSRSRVLIFDEPTRGIDVAAKAEVFRTMNELASQGVGILMISSELLEVMAMADRLLVMARGTITAEYGHGQATQEDIMRSAVGKELS